MQLCPTVTSMGSPPKQAGGGKEIKSSNASEQILQGQQKQIYLLTYMGVLKDAAEPEWLHRPLQ